MATVANAICFGLVIASSYAHPALAADAAERSFTLNRRLLAHDGVATPTTARATPATGHRPKRANFEREIASRDARQVADWVVDSGDNRTLPFVIVDKTKAKVFVFHGDGRLRGAAPALLGLAIGDDAVPGIGDRKLSAIRPEERTTPAGRFVASLDRNVLGVEILWVDYDGAISMHRVITTNPKEHRAQRLATPTPLDNRISYGCINVPVKYFDNVVRPTFARTNGIVYVLPEIKSIRDVFGSYVVD
jgi:hypothetical protein